MTGRPESAVEVRHRRYGPARTLAALVVLTLAVGACTAGEPGDGDQGASGDPAAAGSSAPQELIVGTAGDPWLEPETRLKNRPNTSTNTNVCDTLVRQDFDYQIEPGVASEWEAVGDNTFRFTIDEDATFSDGSPITAEDVKYTMDFIVSEPDVSGSTPLGADATTIVDDRTVEITPEADYPRFVEQIVHPTFSILPVDADPMEDIRYTCSGPFHVVEYEAEEFIVLERNENYWGEPALLDRLEFRFFNDDTTRALALQNGEVDMITDVPRQLAGDLEQTPGLKVARAPVGESMFIYLARLRGPDGEEEEKVMADPLVRRAVAHAVDSEAYINAALGGEGVVTNSISPPSLFGPHADLLAGLAPDPDEAARLLDEAGWTLDDGEEFRTRDGEQLDVDMIFGIEVDLTGAEFVQSQLRAVGFNVTIDQLDAGAYLERRGEGTYDLNVATVNQSTANPMFVPFSAFSARATNDTAPWSMPGPDSEYERLLDATEDTQDVDEVQRLAAEAMVELVTEEVAAVPLAGNYPIFAMRDGVQGFEPHPSRISQRWWTTFIDE